MKDMDFSVKDIMALMAALEQNKIAALRIKNGDFELEIKGARSGASAAGAPGSDAVPDAAPVTTAPEYKGHVVTSPIVGTFYAAPAPDRDPYIQVGSVVKKGDVLFIIESMKLMNEVTSDHAGTVSEILVENAQGVEYGQPILCIV
jgi:acetyl-CoA carboxylase biotin carboxyl carrier protein